MRHFKGPIKFENNSPRILLLFDKEQEQLYLYSHTSSVLFTNTTTLNEFNKTGSSYNLNKDRFHYIKTIIQPLMYNLRLEPFLFFHESLDDPAFSTIQEQLTNFIADELWSDKKLDKNKILTEIKDPYTNTRFLDGLVSRISIMAYSNDCVNDRRRAETARDLLMKYGTNPRTIKILADQIMNYRADSGMDSLDD